MTIQISQKALNGGKEKVVVCEGSGSWLEYLEFQGKVYWTINDAYPAWATINSETVRDEQKEYLLPSDSMHRPDLKCMIDLDFESAEREKHELEQRQR